MAQYSLRLDGLFHALSDATRRAVLERLSHGACSTSELSKPFKMALTSFLQHLDVLQRCGLVQSHKQGRVRTFRLVPGRLAAAEQWMAAQRALWERRLDQLDAFLKETHTKETRKEKP